MSAPYSDAITYLFEVVLSQATSAAGIAGNLISLWILLHGQLRSRPHNKLLVTMAAADTAFLALFMVMFRWDVRSGLGLSETSFNFSVYSRLSRSDEAPSSSLSWLLSGAHTALTLSTFATGALSVHCYLVVCRPSAAASNPAASTHSLCALAVVTAFLFNFLRFYELDSGFEVVGHGSELTLSASRLRLGHGHGSASSLYLAAVDLVVSDLAPYLTMVVLAVCVVSEARKDLWRRKVSPLSSRGRLKASTRLMSMLVTVYLHCHAFKFLFGLYSCFELYHHLADLHLVPEEPWLLLSPLGSWFLLFNSSCKFVIYCTKDEDFEAVLRSKRPFKQEVKEEEEEPKETSELVNTSRV